MIRRSLYWGERFFKQPGGAIKCRKAKSRLPTRDVRDLVSADFYFISMDEGSTKRSIINHLELNNKPYIDAGIGVQLLDDSLIGQVRITMGTPEKNDHIYDRVSFADGVKDEYFSNIQIADLNALNGALSVIGPIAADPIIG